MTRDSFERRRKVKLTLAVLAVGILMSILLAVGLVYMGKMHPRF